MEVDIISIGAHPDDAEVGTGGVLVKMKKLGYSTGIIYLTQGEMGTGGFPELRKKEAVRAAKILGVDLVVDLDFGDCRLEDNYKYRLKIAELIRKFKPRVILAPYPRGGHGKKQSHPDHLAAGKIVVNAANYAMLKKLPIQGEPYQVSAIFHYLLPTEVPPTFVVDITDEFDIWTEAVKAHKSQFQNPAKQYDYLWFLESMVRGYGNHIGVKYGQGFSIGEPMKIENLFCLIE